MTGHFTGWVEAGVRQRLGLRGSAAVRTGCAARRASERDARGALRWYPWQEAWEAEGGGKFDRRAPKGESAKEFARSMLRKNPNAYFYRRVPAREAAAALPRRRIAAPWRCPVAHTTRGAAQTQRAGRGHVAGRVERGGGCAVRQGAPRRRPTHTSIAGGADVSPASRRWRLSTAAATSGASLPATSRTAWATSAAPRTGTS